MSAEKQLWLLAGGNGAGKSTFHRLFLQPLGLHFVNADIIARTLAPDNTVDISYQAARLAETLRTDLLRQGRSFCFETVFSHPSKIDFLAQAKTLGYETILVYIHLQHSQLNLARVAQRVSEGGHGVPDDKVVTRIPRTMAHIQTAFQLADLSRIYDNSRHDAPFAPVAEIRQGSLSLLTSTPPSWLDQVLPATLMPEQTERQ
jgi:predicted ABC-type ATPase